MNAEKIQALGDELYQALRAGKTLAPLTEREPDITIQDAYHISLRMVDQRVQRDGERIVGKKIGVTSRPVQEMLGVFQPDFGNRFAELGHVDEQAADDLALLLRIGLALERIEKTVGSVYADHIDMHMLCEGLHDLIAAELNCMTLKMIREKQITVQMNIRES